MPKRSSGELFVNPTRRRPAQSRATLRCKFRSFPYPLIDPGKWAVTTTAHSVTFTHTLKGPSGFAYLYEKTLSIDGSTMTLSHSLQNTGRKTIDTSVYDHDFYIFDGHPTGPGMSIHFPFKPELHDSLARPASDEASSTAPLERPPQVCGRSDRPITI